MMNIPTRKKAKMPSFHTHQSSNHTDDTYTAYSTPVNRKPGFNHYDPYNWVIPDSYTQTQTQKKKDTKNLFFSFCVLRIQKNFANGILLHIG